MLYSWVLKIFYQPLYCSLSFFSAFPDVSHSAPASKTWHLLAVITDAYILRSSYVFTKNQIVTWLTLFIPFEFQCGNLAIGLKVHVGGLTNVHGLLTLPGVCVCVCMCVCVYVCLFVCVRACAHKQMILCHSLPEIMAVHTLCVLTRWEE